MMGGGHGEHLLPEGHHRRPPLGRQVLAQLHAQRAAARVAAAQQRGPAQARARPAAEEVPPPADVEQRVGPRPRLGGLRRLAPLGRPSAAAPLRRPPLPAAPGQQAPPESPPAGSDESSRAHGLPRRRVLRHGTATATTTTGAPREALDLDAGATEARGQGRPGPAHGSASLVQAAGRPVGLAQTPQFGFTGRPMVSSGCHRLAFPTSPSEAQLSANTPSQLRLHPSALVST